MGMFNDNQSAQRLHWTYKYTGKELLPSATRLYAKFYLKEEEARNKMAEYMKDMNISNTDRRVEEAKRDIVSFGTLKEQCEVFQHEFARNPDKEYELGLGDVTFFELAQKVNK
jgi:hypothetical protein